MSLALDFLSFVFIPLLALFVVYFGKHLHKHETLYYIVVAIITTAAGIFAVYAQVEGIDLASSSPIFYAVLFQGHATFAFFVLVMFAGAFKNKSKPKKVLFSVRRELAILGFLFLIPHTVLLVWLALSNFNPTGTLAFLIMIPLFVTSFRSVKKKMHPKAWFKLHKLAYWAYALIFLHLASITIIFNLLGYESTLELILGFIRFLLYTAIFIVYTVMKVRKTPRKKVTPASA